MKYKVKNHAHLKFIGGEMGRCMRLCIQNSFSMDFVPPLHQNLMNKFVHIQWFLIHLH